jgi:hypothetical protein
MVMIVVETMVACAVGMYVAPPVIRYPSPAFLVRNHPLVDQRHGRCVGLHSTEDGTP